MNLLRPVVAAAAAACLATGAIGATPSLPPLHASPSQTSVSGLSSGAFMAVQLQVAYSSTIVGAGVVAGGPYYCAADNMLLAGICMGQMPLVSLNPSLMVSAARRFGQDGRIDPLDNLAQRRIYVFSGRNDTVVRQPAVNATAAFFQEAGVRRENLAYVNDLPAGHAIITHDHGNECGANSAPYISQCVRGARGYDQAGELLGHIYGPLKAPAAKAQGRIVAFDQREFADGATGMADTGFLYVPPTCETRGGCRVHVAIHGCLQAAESIGDRFYSHAGYNSWAETNRLLVLYPQVNKSIVPFNPQGCWDWWGYTSPAYAEKSGRQMRAIMNMVARLAQPR